MREKFGPPESRDWEDVPTDELSVVRDELECVKAELGELRAERAMIFARPTYPGAAAVAFARAEAAEAENEQLRRALAPGWTPTDAEQMRFSQEVDAEVLRRTRELEDMKATWYREAQTKVDEALGACAVLLESLKRCGSHRDFGGTPPFDEPCPRAYGEGVGQCNCGFSLAIAFGEAVKTGPYLSHYVEQAQHAIAEATAERDEARLLLQREQRERVNQHKEYVALKLRFALAIADRKAELKEHTALSREADRLRHGVPVEGDFVCPDSLALTTIRAAGARLVAVISTNAVRPSRIMAACNEFAAVLADGAAK